MSRYLVGAPNRPQPEPSPPARRGLPPRARPCGFRMPPVAAVPYRRGYAPRPPRTRGRAAARPCRMRPLDPPQRVAPRECDSSFRVGCRGAGGGGEGVCGVLEGVGWGGSGWGPWRR